MPKRVPSNKDCDSLEDLLRHNPKSGTDAIIGANASDSNTLDCSSLPHCEATDCGTAAVKDWALRCTVAAINSCAAILLSCFLLVALPLGW